jgi:ribose 5-phosphate isomerase B
VKKLYIASDHAGFALKESLKTSAKSLGVEFEDLGTHSTDSVHYPDFAAKLCNAVLATKRGTELLECCGVLICGSGVGISIAANRFKKIRAVNAMTAEQARLSREHNASNILALGARLVNNETAQEILKAWLHGKFEGGRHLTRIDLMDSDVQ